MITQNVTIQQFQMQSGVITANATICPCEKDRQWMAAVALLRELQQLHMQVVSLGDIELDREVIGALTDTMAQLYRVVPVLLDDNVLTLATCDPQNLAIEDELRNFLGLDIRLVVATESDVGYTHFTSCTRGVSELFLKGRPWPKAAGRGTISERPVSAKAAVLGLSP